VAPELLPNYLKAADIFVGPSKRAADGWVEAQGLTFVEAMIAGTPVIATRSGGIGDIVRHEETGLLVPEGDPEAIARSVERLAKDPDLAACLAEAGYILAIRDFTRSASAQSFSELFARVRLSASSGNSS
jgi:glycosyltransferase involved in cell wall biosynthesis